MKQAFIFDMFGTLVDWRSGVATYCEPFLTERGLDVDAYSFADYWRSRYGPSMEQIRSGERSYVNLDLLHKENLDRTLVHFGIEKSFSEDARQRINRAWEHLPAWPDVAKGMQLLRSLGFIAPCSNGSIALSIRLARFAGISWDAILGAEIARNYKPESQVYRAAVAALALKPEEVVMVAAHNDDLEAASKAGLQTAFFPRIREYGPDQEQDLKAAENWTYVPTDLIDLARQIRSERHA